MTWQQKSPKIDSWQKGIWIHTFVRIQIVEFVRL